MAALLGTHRGDAPTQAQPMHPCSSWGRAGRCASRAEAGAAVQRAPCRDARPAHWAAAPRGCCGQTRKTVHSCTPIGSTLVNAPRQLQAHSHAAQAAAAHAAAGPPCRASGPPARLLRHAAQRRTHLPSHSWVPDTPMSQLGRSAALSGARAEACRAPPCACRRYCHPPRAAAPPADAAGPRRPPDGL